MTTKNNAPARLAGRIRGEDQKTADGNQHLQRSGRGRRKVVSPIVPDAASSRQAWPEVVSVILDGAATMAANTFADARRLALRLHNERHEHALLALSVASALTEIAAESHRAAEYAAAAEMGGEPWSQN